MLQADRNTLAACAVFERVRAGEPLTMALIGEVMAETGASAWAASSIHWQVRNWLGAVEGTKRLGRR